MRRNCIFTLLAVATLISVVQGASWSGGIKTDSDSWYIYRQSANLSFSYEQSVKGQISAVDFRGRSLSPFHSYYQDLDVNQVRIKERTAATQGTFSSEEQLRLDSRVNNAVNASWEKPAGSDLWTIDFYEKWPVEIFYSKSMSYSGRGINNLDSVGNNLDFVASSFLYNQEFNKERLLNMSLKRMNATVLATDEAIASSQIRATRDTEYRLDAHSTGIAGFKYRQVDPDGETVNAGDERFVGVYDISKKVRMSSAFNQHQKDDDWLPCCYGGWQDMRYYDQKGFGRSASGVFDCRCAAAPSHF